MGYNNKGKEEGEVDDNDPAKFADYLFGDD